MANLDDIMTVLQNMVPALSSAAQAQSQVTPDLSSGVLGASTLINLGFTRVTGVSVVAGSTGGWLHDANAVSSITTSTRVYAISSTPGLYPVQLIFRTGCVFEPGTSMKATTMYAKV